MKASLLMRAARINNYGEPKLITIEDIDLPAPGEGQVQVEVYASSLNPFDNVVLTGSMRESIPLNMPLTLGIDVAGQVSKVGKGVDNFRPGDRVFGSAGVVAGGSGAFAEFAVAKQQKLALMPAKIDYREAAALALTGLCAVQAIDLMNLATGQKILIHGGAGGIGVAAIQYAKHLGLYVASTATGKGIETALELGADQVVDYKQIDFRSKIQDYDAVLDTVAGDTYKQSFVVLKPGGVMVSMNEQPDQVLANKYSVKAFFLSTRTSTESLEHLASLVDKGVIKPIIGASFSLNSVDEAYMTWRRHGVIGKVVIDIKQNDSSRSQGA